jgi:predicted metal-dependent hydrolase
MGTDDEHFRRGIELFNRGEFFEAHEEMEDAMNALAADTSDWDFYLGLLRTSVANHKLGQGDKPAAALHLRAALKFLAPYGDRHRGLTLRELRGVLTMQLAQIDSDAAITVAPRIEFAAASSQSPGSSR